MQSSMYVCACTDMGSMQSPLLKGLYTWTLKV